MGVSYEGWAFQRTFKKIKDIHFEECPPELRHSLCVCVFLEERYMNLPPEGTVDLQWITFVGGLEFQKFSSDVSQLPAAASS